MNNLGGLGLIAIVIAVLLAIVSMIAVLLAG